jgi:maltooligosyltrehalose trehalohydrolase
MTALSAIARAQRMCIRKVFVLFLQNHDQVGNRAFGERLTELVEPRALEAAIALQILAPHIPLLFMAEEYASKIPFLFFSEMNEQLACSIREGRKREFNLDTEELPDLNAMEGFEQSTPRPDPRLGKCRFRFYQSLLALRREHISPHMRRQVAARRASQSAAATDRRIPLENKSL